MDDLQTFLKSYEEKYPEQVLRVRERVPRDYVVTATTLEAEKKPQPPVLIFEKVDEVDIPIVTGLFSNRERIAEAIGTTDDQIHDYWARVSKNLIPPIEVSNGVVQEVVQTGDKVDVGKLPLMRHFQQDAGRYLTSGVIVAKDPDTGIGNLSFARMQLKAPQKFGISVHSRGHLWDYFQRSEASAKPLDVAVVVGGHPAYLIGAASKVGIEVDEVDIVGALLGHPLEVTRAVTVDLLVPAAAEIIIEGRIEPNLREPEGPFGEYTGYATGRSTQNVMTVTAITHRCDPVFLDICPGASRDHLFLGRIQKEAEVLRKLKDVLPNVKGIYYPISGTHFHCYLAIDKKRPGDARHAGLLLLGLDPYIKLVVVVDKDIDITNEADVLWAMATRMQPRQDTFVIDDITCNVLDPSSLDGLSSKMVLDATLPMDWEFERCTVPEESAQLARRLVNTSTASTRVGGNG